MATVILFVAWMACLMVGVCYQEFQTQQNFPDISNPSQELNQEPAHRIVQLDSIQNNGALNMSTGNVLNMSPPPPSPCLSRAKIRHAFKYVTTILSCVIFLVGIVGNSTLLRIIYKNKCMRNGPNVLIASLALGDLFYILIAIPIISISFWLSTGHSEYIYQLVHLYRARVYSLSLCALSIDRYRAVASWNRIRSIGIPVRKAIELTLIWAVAIIVAVPEAIAFNLVELDFRGQTILVCMLPMEQTSDFMRFYQEVKVWWLFGFYFCLPLACTGVFYTLMSCEMLSIKNGMRIALNDHMKQRREVAKTVFCLVVIFALCWLPLHVSSIFVRLSATVKRACILKNKRSCIMAEIQTGVNYQLLMVMNYTGINMASLNSCIGPVALYFVSRKFKNCFQSCLCCWCHRPTLTITPMDEKGSGGKWKANGHDLDLDRSSSRLSNKYSSS
uniref:Endothelin-3 receptor n=1 Tax=Xenopus laevis TaxID=8355 RepID=EDNR3_XENLA|nr:endothelin-3 receptor precursor [Xenopus laevis]P32940.1 RecName: Full=Endothelin-3 receptor; AltName: Full=Endothelin C receptor; Short=ET-C; Short=ET-CR; Flags: Precursor [Xenopus laevis]AAA49704.1 endothelin-3 receptor [Xenopus laevis]